MKKSDPFEVGPLPKAFYHPSREKELSKKDKKICLSAPCGSKDTQQQVSSPEDLKFLKETNTIKTHEIPTRENGSVADMSSTSLFNESWPSTEHTGSLGTPLSDGTVSSSEMSQQMKEWLEQQEKPVTNSTLGWFINRFRNAPPTDRQQRDKLSFSTKNKAEFWWLSPPSGHSTPSGLSTPLFTPPQKLHPTAKKSPSPTSKKRGKQTSFTRSSSLSLHMEDKATAELERRTKELLERSETSMESTSTEPFPLPLKKPSENKPAQTKAGPSNYSKSPQKTTERQTAVSHNPWPEDDILYQWRLARKMEKAQERATAIDIRDHVKKDDPYGVRKAGSVKTHFQPGTIPKPSIFNSTLQGPSGLSSVLGPIIPGRTPQPLPSASLETAPVTTVSTTASDNMDITRGSHAPVTMVTCETNSRPIATPVISQPCRHLETKTNEKGSDICHKEIHPHMHLACDILPCSCTGDAKIYHLQQHNTSNRIGEDRPVTDRVFKDYDTKDDYVKYQDEKKENEIPTCKRSSLMPVASKKSTNFTKQDSRKESVQTLSSCESLSSSTESERAAVKDERESRKQRRKGKQHGNDKRKIKENRKEMVQNVIGQVISEHMFSGQPSTSNDDEKENTTEAACRPDDKDQKKDDIILPDQENLLAESSEDEFADDEILKMLRQRSKDLKNELRRIDSLLQQDL